jgi:hypothetical protein
VGASGGGAGNLEGLAALLTAVTVAAGFVVTLFRGRDDTKEAILKEVEGELLEARQAALEEKVADYDRQVRRVHQLAQFIVDQGLTVPRRYDDE